MSGRLLPVRRPVMDLRPPEWTLHALCAQVGGDMFFPEKGESSAPAKRVCRACTVRNLCLDYAVARQEPFGIWGGTSERERRRLKRERAAQQDQQPQRTAA